MTEDEMKEILQITSAADGGCGHCVKNLWEDFYLKMNFPKHLFLEFTDEQNLRYWTLYIPEWIFDWDSQK